MTATTGIYPATPGDSPDNGQPVICIGPNPFGFDCGEYPVGAMYLTWATLITAKADELPAILRESSRSQGLACKYIEDVFADQGVNFCSDAAYHTIGDTDPFCECDECNLLATKRRNREIKQQKEAEAIEARTQFDDLCKSRQNLRQLYTENVADMEKHAAHIKAVAKRQAGVTAGIAVLTELLEYLEAKYLSDEFSVRAG